MIRLRTSGGSVTLQQSSGRTALTRPTGLVTFTQKQGQAITPPVFQLDFSQPLNSMYLPLL